MNESRQRRGLPRGDDVAQGDSDCGRVPGLSVPTRKLRLTIGGPASIPPGMTSLPLLGELELAMLEHLWISGETDVLHAHALVGAKRGISVNTVGSTLERLFKKGLVEREKVSHAYRYRSAIDRDAFQARRLVQAAGGVETLAREGVLAAFVDLVADADTEALNELERLVRRRRKERAR